MTRIPAIAAGARVHVLSAGDAIDMVVRTVVDPARSRIGAELFKFDESAAMEALQHAADRGVRIRALGDPEYFHQGSIIMPTSGDVQLALRGGIETRRVHTKVVTSDDLRGVMTTAAMDANARVLDKLDVAVELTPELARDARRLTDAARRDGTGRVRRLSHESAERGLYSNDARHGVTELTRAFRGLVANSVGDVYVATKHIEPLKMLAQLQARLAREGRKLLIDVTKTPANEVADVVRRTGADVARTPRGYFHGNVVVAQGRDGVERMLVTTAYLGERAFAPGKVRRDGREIGLVVGADAGIADALRALHQLTGSRADRFARGPAAAA